MTQHWFFGLFICFFTAHQLVNFVLNLLNAREIRTNPEIPAAWKAQVDPATYKKGQNYTLAKLHFATLSQALGIIVTIIAIATGILGHVDEWLFSWGLGAGLTHAVAYCAAIMLGLMLLGIPLSLYNHFVLEARFGFNKMTLQTFVGDFAKMLVLSAVLGIPLLYLIFWLLQTTGPAWWLWAVGAFFGFELFISAVYPTLLAPIFNKFKPLEESSLKDAIYALANQVKFKMAGIFTIDGSKRSSHSNAYFAGMGRFRRIVLFDTIREQMTQPEIIAVLAHEMGHNVKKHVQRQMILSFLFTLVGFWILSVLLHWNPFFETFNAGPAASYKALVLFSLFSGHFTFFLTPLTNYLSRKHEFEADKFSVDTTGDRASMASSLTKLSKENLSNLTPHPWYSFYHYSHPTTLERVAAINCR